MTAEDRLHEIRTQGGRSFKEMQAQQVKRARMTALALATSTMISLMFLVFAFVQKQRAAELEKELLSAKRALENCK